MSKETHTCKKMQKYQVCKKIIVSSIRPNHKNSSPAESPFGLSWKYLAPLRLVKLISHSTLMLQIKFEYSVLNFLRL